MARFYGAPYILPLATGWSIMNLFGPGKVGSLSPFYDSLKEGRCKVGGRDCCGWGETEGKRVKLDRIQPCPYSD